MKEEVAPPTAKNSRATWLRYLLIALVVEKIIQHVFVTLAFYFDWGGIGVTVAVNPRVLMFLGAGVAILFGLALWGLLIKKGWALGLITGLAIFDLIGEFVAQGRLDIVINVSFLVALVLLILVFLYRRQERRATS